MCIVRTIWYALVVACFTLSVMGRGSLQAVYRRMGGKGRGPL